MYLKIENGAPDFEGRLSKEIRTYKLLEQLNIPFERIDHEAAFTIAACEEIDKMFDKKENKVESIKCLERRCVKIFCCVTARKINFFCCCFQVTNSLTLKN